MPFTHEGLGPASPSSTADTDKIVGEKKCRPSPEFAKGLHTKLGKKSTGNVHEQCKPLKLLTTNATFLTTYFKNGRHVLSG